MRRDPARAAHRDWCSSMVEAAADQIRGGQLGRPSLAQPVASAHPHRMLPVPPGPEPQRPPPRTPIRPHLNARTYREIRRQLKVGTDRDRRDATLRHHMPLT